MDSQTYFNKYKKYKLKYINLLSKIKHGGTKNTYEINKSIKTYFDGQSDCITSFGLKEIKFLTGGDTGASESLIGHGIINGPIIGFPGELHVVVKILKKECGYMIADKKYTGNGITISFNKNEIGIMRLLTDKLLLPKCTPNIVWLYKGGVCKKSYIDALCRINNQQPNNLPGNFLIDDRVIEGNFMRQFRENLIDKIENIGGNNKLMKYINDSYVSYLLVEKCEASLNGLISGIVERPMTIKDDEILMSIIIQIFITLKILRLTLSNNDFEDIDRSSAMDGCYIKIKNKKDYEKVIRINENSVLIKKDNSIIEIENDNIECFSRKNYFIHRDLHTSNVLISETDTQYISYDITDNDKRQKFIIKTYGAIPKLWDFETCDIACWKESIKNNFFSYYNDYGYDNFSKTGKVVISYWMNNEYSLLYHMFNKGAMSENRSLKEYEGESNVINFIKNCLSLGKQTDFIRLLIDQDEEYKNILDINNTERTAHVVSDYFAYKIRHYIDEFEKDEQQKHATKEEYIFNDTHKVRECNLPDTQPQIVVDGAPTPPHIVVDGTPTSPENPINIYTEVD